MEPDQPTTLWTLRKDDREVACLVRLVPYGIEVEIARNGVPVITRTFDTGDEALAWADWKRATREAEGWTARALGGEAHEECQS
jgi:hypothetical protein